MKELLQFLLGIVLMIAGGVMFLKNVVVSDWGLLSSLFRIGGGVNIGGIFIVLLVIAFIALLVKPNMGTGLVFTGLCIAFFVCIIISLNVSLRYMSGLELTLILGTLCVGIALPGKILRFLYGISMLKDYTSYVSLRVRGILRRCKRVWMIQRLKCTKKTG